MLKKIFSSFLISLIIFNVALAQTFKTNVSKRGTTAATFLSIGQSARAIGMGSAFVGVVNDVSSIYWNPAGLTKAQGGQVMFDHTRWIAGTEYNFLAVSYNIGDYGTVGVSFIGSNIGDMKVTTIEEPWGTGEVFSATDMAISIAYALQLTDRFSIGFNPKFVYQGIWKMSASAFAIDMGVQYVTPFDDAILAMSISNFGTEMRLLGQSNLVLYDPDPFTTGNNNKIPAYLETKDWALPLTFRVGVAYNPIKSETHRLTFAFDALHPSDDYESVNLGFEYGFEDFLFLRGGYKSLFLDDSEESYALGFGVKKNLIGNVAIKVDYAYQDFGRLNNIQKFSLTVCF
ncbi:MAG: PorV/PorQ family protein [Ignavibacteria bacterium]|nr:PorV/PorQ family protein [Ignavibacteria bacterium]